MHFVLNLFFKSPPFNPEINTSVPGPGDNLIEPGLGPGVPLVKEYILKHTGENIDRLTDIFV